MSAREVLNLIPIAADVDVVEAFAPQDAAPPTKVATGTAVAATPSQSAAAGTQPSDTARSAALAQARSHLQNGDARAAAESLRLVDLKLIARQVSMPLAQTLGEVEHAIALVDAGKLHKANLALKQMQDGPVVAIAEFGEPTAPAPVATAAPAPAATPTPTK